MRKVSALLFGVFIISTFISLGFVQLASTDDEKVEEFTAVMTITWRGAEPSEVDGFLHIKNSEWDGPVAMEIEDTTRAWKILNFFRRFWVLDLFWRGFMNRFDTHMSHVHVREGIAEWKEDGMYDLGILEGAFGGLMVLTFDDGGYAAGYTIHVFPGATRALVEGFGVGTGNYTGQRIDFSGFGEEITPGDVGVLTWEISLEGKILTPEIETDG